MWAEPKDAEDGGAVHQVKDERQRRKQLVELRQMLPDDRFVLARHAPPVHVLGPFDEDRLRLGVEAEMREPDVVVRRGRTPGHGVEVRQRLEHREGRISCSLVRHAIPPFPAARIRVDEQLEPLQHAVVRQRVHGLFQINGQLVGLDATEDRHAQVGDADMPTSDPVSVKTLIAVPAIEEEGTLPLASFAFPSGNQPDQFIPQHQQAGGIFAQQLTELFHRAVVGFVTAQCWRVRGLLAMRTQFPGNACRIALAGFPGCILDAPFDGILVGFEDYLVSFVVRQRCRVRLHRFGNQTIQRLQGYAPGWGFLGRWIAHDAAPQIGDDQPRITRLRFYRAARADDRAQCHQRRRRDEVGRAGHPLRFVGDPGAERLRQQRGGIEGGHGLLLRDDGLRFRPCTRIFS